MLLPLLLTITSCVTVRKTEIVLLPEPQRQELKAPETLKDYAALILYYDNLVKEWELWAEDIKAQIGD